MAEGGVSGLKARLAAGETLIGTFVKTPDPIVVEVLALTGLACLCLDAEHAPFDRRAIDACVHAAHAAGKEVLVRLPATLPEHALNALDCGATGIVAPHVRSTAEASALAAMCRYAVPGGRGYAGSSRAAAYTTRTMATNLAAAERTVVIAQIEDPEAIDDIDGIAQVNGIDCLFVGRADLTVSYGTTDQDDPRVIAAVEAVCAAGRRHGKPVGMFLARESDVPGWVAKGASLFLLGSDHTFLLAGAKALLAKAVG